MTDIQKMNFSFQTGINSKTVGKNRKWEKKSDIILWKALLTSLNLSNMLADR
jgi:hypothetical protein